MRPRILRQRGRSVLGNVETSRSDAAQPGSRRGSAEAEARPSGWRRGGAEPRRVMQRKPVLHSGYARQEKLTQRLEEQRWGSNGTERACIQYLSEECFLGWISHIFFLRVIGTSVVKFSVGKTVTGALNCIQIFYLINKPSKLFHRFSRIGFFQGHCPKNTVSFLLCALCFSKWSVCMCRLQLCLLWYFSEYFS